MFERLLHVHDVATMLHHAVICHVVFVRRAGVGLMRHTPPRVGVEARLQAWDSRFRHLHELPHLRMHGAR
eukprot:3747693-Alexandrium_andersonii.AAC.1